MSGEEENSLESTPTWSISTVCSVFIITSLGLQQGLHYLGKSLKKHNRRSLYDALQKLKEELMLLGFISLLLTVFKYPIGRICISRSLTRLMLPCRKKEYENNSPKISETPSEAGGYCEGKGKVPLLSIEGMHQLHMFVFVLAIVHVVYCAMTMILGAAKIHSWKRWEAEIKKNLMSECGAYQKRLTDVTHDDFMMSHTNGHWIKSETLEWIESFWRQFYGSVRRSDYKTLRLGFIEEHCRANKNFDFHNYLVRCLEVDFKKVVGISGYHWAFVVIFLLLNNHGWNSYFWMAFLPIILLLFVGTKLQHVIKRMAQEVIKKNNAGQGGKFVRLSNEHFWFGRPQLVLHLIHFILFQNAFELAFVLWITVNFGFTSCMLSKVYYMIPRVFMGVLVQFLCSYCTFPLYALVTQMGYTFKRSIFEEHIQQSLIGWCKKSKKKNKARFLKEQDNGNDSLQQRKLLSNRRLKIQRLIKSVGEKQKSGAITIRIDSP